MLIAMPCSRMRTVRVRAMCALKTASSAVGEGLSTGGDTVLDAGGRTRTACFH